MLQPHLVPKYVASIEVRMVAEPVDADADWEKRDIKPDAGVVIREAALRYDVEPRMQSDSAQPDAEPAAPTPVVLRVPQLVQRRLSSVRIKHVASREPVVAIEILSPTNKRAGAGREKYLRKRSLLLNSLLHFIEIDLLRRWSPMPLEGDVPPSDYRVMLADGEERPRCILWPISVRDKLPQIPVPLLPPDEPVTLDLGAALATLYERARYDLQIDYTQMPEGPLSGDDAAWVVALMKHCEATKQELREE